MLEKDNIFIITIILFPFILSLLILRFIDFLKDKIYDYIIIILSLIFIFCFIETLFFILDEIIHSNNKKRIAFVVFIPFIYIPIYYFKNFSSTDKYLSIFISLLNVFLITGFYYSFRDALSKYFILSNKDKIVLKDTFKYSDKNNNFTIRINENYRCNNDIEGYVIACDNIKNDSFIGIYSYEDNNFTQGKLDDILSFHFEEILNVIKENNYDGNIEYLDNYVKISYNDMVVLLTQRNYFFKDSGYSLIIIKESRDYSDNIKDFENVIETIEFIS